MTAEPARFFQHGAWQRARCGQSRTLLQLCSWVTRLSGVRLAADEDVSNLTVYQHACMVGQQGTDGVRLSAMNVQLSLEETYADVVPLRPEGASSAFLSIMRGCNNMCAFCIVPFTRGRERSRPAASIIDEVRLPLQAMVSALSIPWLTSMLTIFWLQRSYGVHTREAEGRSGKSSTRTLPDCWTECRSRCCLAAGSRR